MYFRFSFFLPPHWFCCCRCCCCCCCSDSSISSHFYFCIHNTVIDICASYSHRMNGEIERTKQKYIRGISSLIHTYSNTHHAFALYLAKKEKNEESTKKKKRNMNLWLCIAINAFDTEIWIWKCFYCLMCNELKNFSHGTLPSLGRTYDAGVTDGAIIEVYRTEYRRLYMNCSITADLPIYLHYI